MTTEKMNWIYEGVSGLIDKEEYLTGRRVDKTFEIAKLEQEGSLGDFNFSEQNVPSLLESGKLSKLDLELTLKEDPLQEIQRRQTEVIKEILNNPIKMRRIKHLLEESLRKEKEERKLKKLKKKMKKEAKKKNKQKSDKERDGRLNEGKGENIDHYDKKSYSSSKDNSRNDHRIDPKNEYRVERRSDRKDYYTEKRSEKNNRKKGGKRENEHEEEQVSNSNMDSKRVKRERISSKYCNERISKSSESKMKKNGLRKEKNLKKEFSRNHSSTDRSDSKSKKSKLTQAKKSVKLKKGKRKYRSSSSSSSSSNNSNHSSDNSDSSNNRKLSTSSRHSNFSSNSSRYSNYSSSSASTLLSKHRSRSRSIVKNSRNRRRSSSNELKSNNKSSSSKLTDKSSNKLINKSVSSKSHDKSSSRLSDKTTLKYETKIKESNLKDSKDKAKMEGEDWIDLDYKYVAPEIKAQIDTYVFRPLSRERQELKNKRLENSYPKSQDVVDRSASKLANFNANTSHYNYYTDNKDSRNAKRRQVDESSHYVKRHINEERFHKDRGLENKSDYRSNDSKRYSSNRFYDQYKEEFSRNDDKDKLARMQTQGLWREKERTRDVKMYNELNERQEIEIQYNLNRHLTRNY